MEPREPNPPCQVRTLGLIQSQPLHSTPVTKEGDTMLTVVVGGRGRLRMAGGETLPVEAGMVGIALGNEQGVLMSETSEPYLHYYCRFRGAYAVSLADRIRAAADRVRQAPAPFFASNEVRSSAGLLHRHGHIARRALPSRCGPEGLAVLAILEKLLEEIDDRITRSRRAFSFASILRDYLFEHVADPTDLDAIAADLGLSRSTLTRRSRREAGTSVQDLHRATKIEWARQLLSATDEPVSEIARRVGYADPFYFTRVFRAQVGESPRAFRKRPAS